MHPLSALDFQSHPFLKNQQQQRLGGLIFLRRTVSEGVEQPPLIGASLEYLRQEYAARLDRKRCRTAKLRHAIRDQILQEAGGLSYDHIEDEFGRIKANWVWPAKATFFLETCETPNVKENERSVSHLDLDVSAAKQRVGGSSPLFDPSLSSICPTVCPNHWGQIKTCSASSCKIATYEARHFQSGERGILQTRFQFRQRSIRPKQPLGA
jgi:hypothetical protein